MWRIIISLSLIIVMHTGILSQSTVTTSENGLKYLLASSGIHWDTNTNGSVQSPYRFGAKAQEKYNDSMLERHKQIHIDDTYPTPQDEKSRFIHQLDVSDVINDVGNVSAGLTRRQAPRQICQRLPLIVNFRSIGWKWIYEPTEFSAFVCEGECDKALSDLNSVLYAQVQALDNATKASKNKPLCCVPTKTSSLYVDYFKGRNKYTLMMKDIIVEECGCR